MKLISAVATRDTYHYLDYTLFCTRLSGINLSYPSKALALPHFLGARFAQHLARLFTSTVRCYGRMGGRIGISQPPGKSVCCTKCASHQKDVGGEELERWVF